MGLQTLLLPQNDQKDFVNQTQSPSCGLICSVVVKKEL